MLRKFALAAAVAVAGLSLSAAPSWAATASTPSVTAMPSGVTWAPGWDRCDDRCDRCDRCDDCCRRCDDRCDDRCDIRWDRWDRCDDRCHDHDRWDRWDRWGRTGALVDLDVDLNLGLRLL
ncbi:hypothetical protein [Microtetraspora malaysiensis]|uniref:hypothetical protein n=1 Tax=Microtetraspora malaysiensis TaxID=161358 RepID=UPI000829DAF1|nr:hypothetical protein [Microtetraspora malaysiensis]